MLLALGVANSFRPSVRSSSASRATSRCFTPLPIVSSVAYRSFTPSMMNGPGGDDLESLFDQIKDLDPEDVPEDIQNAIRDRISENAPSDWKIRLNLMGFNPLTIAGYLLAAVILTLPPLIVLTASPLPWFWVKTAADAALLMIVPPAIVE